MFKGAAQYSEGGGGQFSGEVGKYLHRGIRRYSWCQDMFRTAFEYRTGSRRFTKGGGKYLRGREIFQRTEIFGGIAKYSDILMNLRKT
jgi:hypothetical protein